MIKRFILMLALLLPLFLSAFTGWKTISNEHFIIYHKSAMELQALNLLQSLEIYRPFAEELCGNQRKRIPILIEDIGNVANGFANPVGNSITLFNHLPTDNELSYMEDWWTLVGVHEYIHMLQMTTEGGLPKALRIMFGNLAHTNFLIPMWMLEGITVFCESSISPYTGRLNGGYYPAIIRNLAYYDKLPSITKAGYYSIDTPHAHYYVFGSSFFDYLAEAYGAEKFAEFYQTNGSNPLSYLSPILPGMGIDLVAKDVFGKPFEFLWEDWIAHEKSLAADLRLADQLLGSDGWFKSALKFHAGKLFFTKREAQKTSALSAFAAQELLSLDPKTGQTERILSQSADFPTAYQIQGNQLYYTRNEYHAGFDNRTNLGLGSIPELWQMDMTNKKRTLIYSGSFRAFLVKEDGSILIAEEERLNEGSVISEITKSGKKEIFRDPDYMIHALWENEGKIYVNARKFWRNSSIYELKDRQFIPIIDTPNREIITGFSGDNIVFSANYEEFLHCYVYQTSSQQVFRLEGADYMTDAQIDLEAQKTYYLTLTDEGFEISADPLLLTSFEIAEYPENAPAYTPIKNVSNMDSNLLPPYTKGGYTANLLHMINPRQARIPLIFSTPDTLTLGYVLSGSDVIGHFPYWQSTLLYDLKQEHFRFDFALDVALLNPLRQSLYYSTINEQTLSCDNSLYLFVRQNYGMNTLKSGLLFLTKNDYSRKIWQPYLDFSFSYPGIINLNRIFIKNENSDWMASDRQRFGYGAMHHTKILLPGSIQLSQYLQWNIDPQAEKNEVFYPVRGYSTELLANKGLTLQTTLSRILLEIREGMWNPQIYMEDISGSIFFDLAAPAKGEGAEMQYAIGIEMAMELSSMFWVSTALGGRVSLNRQRKPGFGITIGAQY